MYCHFFVLTPLNASLEKGLILHLKECLVEIAPVILEKNGKFCYFVIVSPWKRECPFIWTNLSSLLKVLCAKFGWNLPGPPLSISSMINILLSSENYLPCFVTISTKKVYYLNLYKSGIFIYQTIKCICFDFAKFHKQCCIKALIVIL